MNKTLLKYIITITLAAGILSGCVTSQNLERQGTKAYFEKDYETVQQKYTEASAEGSAKAKYHLAVMYAEGKGVDQDYAKAAQLLDEASKKNHSDSQLMLGLFNVYGDGVPVNPEKGANLITLAAKDGNDTAMYYLGNLYAVGLGVDKDIPTALKWMQKAKKNGFPVKEELLTQEGLAALYKK